MPQLSLLPYGEIILPSPQCVGRAEKESPLGPSEYWSQWDVATPLEQMKLSLFPLPIAIPAWVPPLLLMHLRDAFPEPVST